MHSRWDEAEFRRLLQSAIDDTGLSQREVAGLAGVSHSQISRWMNGLHRPSYDNVRQLAGGLQQLRPSLGDLTAPLLRAAGYGDPLTAEERAAAEAFIAALREGRARIHAREAAEREGNGHTASA
jgi:transcriptional regulator with XRE-family HTH domain